MFATPLRNASASNVAKQFLQIFLRTSCIPKIILSDLGTQFTALVMKVPFWLLEVKLEYATVKHLETIGSLERTHASLKQYLGIYEHKSKHDWHNSVDLAVFSYKIHLITPP